MSWIKRNGRLLACLSLLFLSASGAAVLFSESAAVAAASWGLSFRTEGQPPLADVSPDALKPYDVQVQLRHARMIYPEDRLSVMIMVHGNVTQEVLGALRRAVAGASGGDVESGYVAACKAYMKHKCAVRMNEPEYWLHAMAMRYLDGKDYTTGYAARIDAVSENDIRKILDLLEKGSRIEYIINSK